MKVCTIPKSLKTGAVVRRPVEFMRQKGWLKVSDGWMGEFETGKGYYQGKILTHRNGDVEVWVKNPNQVALETHPHRLCFNSKGEGWYWIHQYGPAQATVEGAFISAEQVLRDMDRGTILPGSAKSLSIANTIRGYLDKLKRGVL